ncbi:Sec34-like family-domain-containing protein [Pseudoneurospora amorphoporcata]|uniref:Conserved oligomeric Golgi complex subunit 3 n=1 Tax=Pseudoneurospora amorphoporcata TaxID=241081 RepID=A0AAN6NZY1_9PEZI|nr:Sec34-like family-domain-containing protein [Pseudoneurospora amorphoporcata]
MYDEHWYSFQEVPQSRPSGVKTRHRRANTLLQQPEETTDNNIPEEPLPALFEDQEDVNAPPEATVLRRAKSYSDFYDIATAHLADGHGEPKKKTKKAKGRRSNHNLWDALMIPPSAASTLPVEEDAYDEGLSQELLQASQQEYLLYHDQLALTERHLGTLIDDANSALKTLETLCQSFRAVEEQTTSFKAQCDDLLEEQKRLQTLADEVGTDLHYYAYLDNVSRRLNALGAGRLVDDDAFGDILANLDSCIEFMIQHPQYRDADTYQARYQALLTKAIHLLEVGFNNRLDQVSGELARQITNTHSESARHALAYGRFEEILMNSYSLIPNIQRVILGAYDQNGQPRTGPNVDIFANTANNLFHAYFAVRDRDLKPLTQHDLATFHLECKESSIDTAARNYVKQCFERSFSEATLFRKIFFIEAPYSSNPKSAFAALNSHQRSLVTGTNIAPIATNLQSKLQTCDLQTICNLVGWITNEYLLVDYDEDETPFVAHCRELTSRLLGEHLWTFTDGFFDAEITKSITKAVIPPEALKLGATSAAAEGGSSAAFPVVERAVELLVLFDQSMPKERCQRNSPVIFKLVRETIAALQRAEVRIKALAKNGGTDPDLFMIKNLLILKNELLTLEIGDVRNGTGGQGATGALGSSIQHLGQIWESLPTAGNLFGLVSSSVSTFSSYIPGSSLLSRAAGSITGSGSGSTTTMATPVESQDAGEQLDELLRQSIYAFTRRWAAVFNEAKVKASKVGGKNLTQLERELDEILEAAFDTQPEVVEKLKEAIQLDAQAQLTGGSGGAKTSGSRTGGSKTGKEKGMGSAYTGGSRASMGSSRRL